MLIKTVLSDSNAYLNQEVVLEGWIKTQRSQKTFGFIELNDGSSFDSLQIVFTDTLPNFEAVDKLTLGSSIRVTGPIVTSAGQGQAIELQARTIEIVGLSTPDNPIQKKRHTFEFLRTLPHLRPRTNTFRAVFRVRSLLAYAIHKFFQERNFVYIHTPIITTIDAEGAGEMFHVTTLDANKLPRTPEGAIDATQELLGRNAHLTVSGQLAVEPFCFAFRDVYTFGPTFRAENSNTARHANEFWMIEPEMAFAALEQDMETAEALIKYMITHLLENAQSEMKFFNDFVDKGLIERMEAIVKSEFAVTSYTEAINLLAKSNKTFEFPTAWGENLQTEHERYLSEEVFKKPVFVTDYPKDLKAFYMKSNADGRTVRAMDLLVPEIGEIIGGSQREDDLELLKLRMSQLKMQIEDYEWYLEIRKYGTFPHAGFGLGFERAVMYFTGMKNIRDVIPYPRTPNNAIF